MSVTDDTSFCASGSLAKTATEQGIAETVGVDSESVTVSCAGSSRRLGAPQARRLGVITIDYVIVFLASSSTTAQAAKNVLSQSNIASTLTANIGAKITAAVSAGTISASE